MSIKPGARTRPVPSTSRAAVSVRPASMADIRPSRLATSADRGALPVPSMTVAPRINKSSMHCLQANNCLERVWFYMPRSRLEQQFHRHYQDSQPVRPIDSLLGGECNEVRQDSLGERKLRITTLAFRKGTVWLDRDASLLSEVCVLSSPVYFTGTGGARDECEWESDECQLTSCSPDPVHSDWDEKTRGRKRNDRAWPE